MTDLPGGLPMDALEAAQAEVARLREKESSLDRMLALFKEVQAVADERDSALARLAEIEKQKMVATVRVTHRGYGMVLSTYVAYALPEGTHNLYAAAGASPVPSALQAANEELITALAACRDAFPAPDAGSRLDDWYCTAMADPLEVPDYVKAHIAAWQAKVAGLKMSLRESRDLRNFAVQNAREMAQQCNAALARLAELEKQEPSGYLFSRPGISKIDVAPHGGDWKPLYLAAGAYPVQPVRDSAIDFLPHDDHLRFIQRVLESDAPKADREAAAQMARDLRRSVYKAQPSQAGELSVWFGPMPESNGKSNWTAILHKGDLADGFQFGRSEYKDRVRYDADCMRHLIGELPNKPDILAYDGDLKEDCRAAINANQIESQSGELSGTAASENAPFTSPSESTHINANGGHRD